MLEEAGLPYELTDLTIEESRGAAHRKRHPLGRVPVLAIDGTCVFESAALCLHIADLTPSAELIPPPGSVERALAYQWTFFAMTEIEAPVGEILRNREDHPDVARVATERAAHALAAVDAALAGREWLVGDHFGAVDVITASVLAFARYFQLTSELPHVTSYLERAESRPAFERAKADRAASRT